MRNRLILVAGTVLSAIALLPAAPARAYPVGCTASASGVDDRSYCDYFGIPWPLSYATLYVDGYGFMKVSCSGLLVVNSGVKPSGWYRYDFINPGGSCLVTVGSNGYAQGYSN